MTKGVACASCGTRLRGNARFCDECGAATAPSTDTAQYKQVTVLFADVVRSMDLAAVVDLERLREIMSELVQRLAAVAQRYGGTVEYTGDGVMALFGAPVALEDHAFRACLAALELQEEAIRLGVEVRSRDGVDLLVRVGLNSGRVIVGEIGSGSLGYRATGQPVGMAQRMESAARPGEVMLAESTAELVEHATVLAPPELVHVKGSVAPVCARRLLAVKPRHGLLGRAEVSLVGRRWEMAALEAISDRAIGGRGGVVNVVGPPGIGKSRMAREAAAVAASRDVEVVWGFCESHARDVPLHAVTRLLRASSDVADLDGPAARTRVRQQTPGADPQDLLLLDDLLGIGDPNVPPPQMDPDMRRRRLTALISTRALTRAKPTLFIIEDAHWIDAVSESMLADFLAVIPRTTSMVLITSRPEYEGALLRVQGAQKIALGPLGDSDTTALLGKLLGPDPSVVALAAVIAERAAGNPFFVEEIVRDMAQRGVLAGERGGYTCRADVADVSVPATVAAAIDARIDRLSIPARRTLNAASVIGARFGADLLSTLAVDAAFGELLDAELIDQVRFTPRAEYAFRHPLIRAVAYESQLKSDRAEWHHRLANAIQEHAPGTLEENAALIGEHLQAAGKLHEAYGWHMRAGAWATNRDLPAARISWERATSIADRLPDDDPDRLSMRIAPRTMLCATDWQARAVQESRPRFAELRELCTAAGDKISLAIGMTALGTDLCYAGRARDAAALAFEQMGLLESVGDPTPLIGVAHLTFVNWLGVGEFDAILRWSQTIVDQVAGDPGKGAHFGMGSPLAITLAWRGTARWWLGRPGWRQDLLEAVEMARRSNPETLSGAVAWTYGFAIQYGVLRTSEPAVCVSEEAVRAAENASSDRALGLAGYTLAVGLLNRDAAEDRQRGLELMMHTRELWLRQRALFLIPVTDLWAARETARRGDLDAAIEAMRGAVDELREAGNLFYGPWGAGLLVEALLNRGTANDVADAEAEIERLANLWVGQDAPMPQIWLLRLRTLLARARGEHASYRDVLTCYRDTAESLGYEGHLAWAEAMIEKGN